jgi:hypothetical protein
MKNGHMWLLVCWLAAAPALAGVPATAFTYQGRLLDGGQPANGAYDLQFALSSAPIEGSYLGYTLGIAPVLISNGLFTVTLDFGEGMFDGSARWIEIGVRPNGSTDPYTLLSPRQPITAAPFALYASAAGDADNASGTNTTIYGGLNLAGPTNVVLYATNQTVVTTPPNTNVIVVSGAGVDPANGAYTLQSASPNPLYVNANGLQLVYTPDDPDYAWEILGPTGVVLYGSRDDDFSNAGGWEVVHVMGPTPAAVAYGVNLVTNSVMQLAVAGAKVPGPVLGNELYVNAAIGNDLFAQRGRPDQPYKTVYAALQDATTNDVVRVGPGIYNETPFRMTLPPGLKLIGAGKRVTCIYGPPGLIFAANLDLSSSNVLSSFSTDFIISLGGYSLTYPTYGGTTNALLENIEAYGRGDVVYGAWWQGFRAVNCDFISRSDCFADAQSGDAGTNAVAELYNCRLFTDCQGLSHSSNHGIASLGRGQIRMFGGSIEARNSDESACVLAGGGAGSSVELSGVSLRYSTTNSGGVALAIYQINSNCLVNLKGMLVNPADVSGSVAYEGRLPVTNLVGGLTTNIPVLGPGMVPSLLCFTNGVLMDVK